LLQVPLQPATLQIFFLVKFFSLQNSYRKTFSLIILTCHQVFGYSSCMQTENLKPVKVAHSFYIPLELLDAIKQRARDLERSVNWLAIKMLTDGINQSKGDPK